MMGSSTSRKDNRQKIAVGTHPYDCRTSEDVTIRRGTRMIILDNTSSELWIKVRLLESPEEGWVPRGFIAPEDSLQSEEWFMDVNKNEGFTLLNHPKNAVGAFLIRRSEENPKEFVLVLKTRDERVRQLIIHWSETSSVYYLTLEEKFKALKDLVQYYRGKPVYVKTQLTEVSIKVPTTVVSLSRSDDDHYEIDKHDITTQQKIGQGSFGKVYKGLWKNTVPVAVKQMKKNTMKTEEFVKEAQMMKNLIHPNLVKLHGLVTVETIWIITELVEKGDLLTFLRKAEDLSSSILFTMSYQIDDAMCYLAGRNIIHRDLAARNVLVTEELSVKIADFGMARFHEDGIYEAHPGTKFPTPWTAPEVLEKLICSEKSDVWSFGIVLYELYSRGTNPYPGFPYGEILPSIKSGYRCPKPMECPDYIYEIMKRCWQLDPKTRPTFFEIKKLVQDINLDDDGYFSLEEQM